MSVPRPTALVTALSRGRPVQPTDISGTITSGGNAQTIASENIARTLAEAREEAVARIRADYAAQLATPMAWQSKFLQVDDDSQLRMAAIGASIANGVPLPAGFAWRMADNSFLPLNAAGFLAMASAAQAHVYPLRVRLWAGVDAARAAATNEDADAVTF